MVKPTICVDFDGVMNSYKSGYGPNYTVDHITDPPTPYCADAIKILRASYVVIIHSTRAVTDEGKQAIKDWLKKYDIVVDGIMAVKPPAMMYIDDRAIPFRGNWFETLEAVNNFKHWFLDDTWIEEK